MNESLNLHKLFPKCFPNVSHPISNISNDWTCLHRYASRQTWPSHPPKHLIVQPIMATRKFSVLVILFFGEFSWSQDGLRKCRKNRGWILVKNHWITTLQSFSVDSKTKNEYKWSAREQARIFLKRKQNHYPLLFLFDFSYIIETIHFQENQ